MKVLSFPVRLDRGKFGSFVKIDQDSDEYRAQQIAAFVNTERGERPICQEFGIPDPTFTGFDELAFAADFSVYYPSMVITEVKVEEVQGATRNITVEFA